MDIKQKITYFDHWFDIPEKFSGIAARPNLNSLKWHFLNGKTHKLDGPAKFYSNQYKQYYINGKFICDSDDENHEQYFYNSKQYKQWTLLENMKLIKNIT